MSRVQVNSTMISMFIKVRTWMYVSDAMSK
jgi:hypothetical protein